MPKNLSVQNLDFDNVKQSLIDFLKAQDQFKDYDFTGSAMNILIELLSYNTHYMGFFAHMLANESFINSASLRSTMAAKAKLLNYIPGSKIAAKALVSVDFNVDAINAPNDRKIILRRGTIIKSSGEVNREFIVPQNTYVYNRSNAVNVYEYTTDEFIIYEGSFETQRFLVDKTLHDQRFVIRDPNIDINTLEVKVYSNDTETDYDVFTLAKNHTSINSNSKVFFLSLNEENYYEIFFGNDVYGKGLEHNNYVEATYVASNGSDGNFAKNFSFDSSYQYNDGQTIKTFEPTVLADNPSSGGVDAESVEDLRFNIPYHFRRQNRAVTVDDYKNLILSEYRNVNSVNVWGGEDNIPKTYGKVYISIKPRYGNTLSSNSKRIILDTILRKYNTATIEPVLVDPDFLYINLNVFVKYNPLNTNTSQGSLRTLIDQEIAEYDTEVLNRFGNFYSDAVLSNRIIDVDSSVLSCYNEITLEKRFTPAIGQFQTYYVDFNNALIKGTLKTDEFEYRGRRNYIIDDGSGNLIAYYYNDVTKVWVKYPDETFGNIDYTNGIVRFSGFSFDALYQDEKILRVLVEPKNPDFYTRRNNIVTIDDYTINISEDLGTESTT